MAAPRCFFQSHRLINDFQYSTRNLQDPRFMHILQDYQGWVDRSCCIVRDAHCVVAQARSRASSLWRRKSPFRFSTLVLLLRDTRSSSRNVRFQIGLLCVISSSIFVNSFHVHPRSCGEDAWASRWLPRRCSSDCQEDCTGFRLRELQHLTGMFVYLITQFCVILDHVRLVIPEQWPYCASRSWPRPFPYHTQAQRNW